MDGQSSPPVRAAVDVVAITSRDDFLLELGEALGGQASITPVESAAQAVELLGKSRRLQVLAIDSRNFADMRAEIDSLQAQVPQVSVLVFADADHKKDVAAMLK